MHLVIGQRTIARLCIESQGTRQWDEDLTKAAIKWSHEKSKRCGRSALHFARHWLGQNMLGISDGFSKALLRMKQSLPILACFVLILALQA